MSHSVLFVLYEQVQGLDVTGPLEVFGAANSIVPGAYQVSTAAFGGVPARTTTGLLLTPDTALESAPAADTVIVPGGPGARRRDPAMVEWLRGQRPTRLVSVCTGAFLLAEAGWLDGRRATTHWHWCADLASGYPGVLVEPDPIFVRDGHITTSAGVTAGIDLALALVEEDLGHQVAVTIARLLVVFLRRPGNQAQFSVQMRAQAARREPIPELQQWIGDNLAADLSIDALAERARLSPRHFSRTFQEQTGLTPGRYVERVRLEHARRLLEEGLDSIETIARATGYRHPEIMRRAFVRALDVAPSEYRRRFHTARG